MTATLIDLPTLRRNIAALGAEDMTRVIAADARTLPRAAQPCDLALLDPPYGMGLAAPILQSLHAQNWLRPGAIVTVETEAGEPLDPPAGYTLRDRRATGRAAVSVFTVK